MLIDAHARLPRGSSAAELLVVMDGCGIDRAVVSAGAVVPVRTLASQLAHGGHSLVDPDNAAVLRAATDHPDRIVPLWFGNPHAEGASEYDAAAADVAGLELSPAVHGLGLTHPAVTAMLDIAEAHRHAVYMVCLPRDGSRVEDLVRVARERPGVRWALGHCGIGPLDLAAVATVAPVPSISVEISCTLFHTAQVALAELGPERVMFGTEYPHQHPAAELAKARHLTVDPAVEAIVLGSAARRWLGELPVSAVAREAEGAVP